MCSILETRSFARIYKTDMFNLEKLVPLHGYEPELHYSIVFSQRAGAKVKIFKECNGKKNGGFTFESFF